MCLRLGKCTPALLSHKKKTTEKCHKHKLCLERQIMNVSHSDLIFRQQYQPYAKLVLSKQKNYNHKLHFWYKTEFIVLSVFNLYIV